MCYSARSSLISYSIGIISGIFALLTRQWVLAFLIFAFVQMQLAELLIWKSIDENNDDLNKKSSSFGKYLLATHNIAIGIGIIFAILYISKKKLKFTDFIPLIIGILFFIFIVVYIYLPNNYPDMTLPLDPTCRDKTNRCQNPDNRLLWPWPHDWYIYSFIISLIILLFYIKPLNTKILLSIAFTSTFILTAIIQPKVMGSIWCNVAAVMCPILVCLNFFIIKNMNSENILT